MLRKRRENKRILEKLKIILIQALPEET